MCSVDEETAIVSGERGAFLDFLLFVVFWIRGGSEVNFEFNTDANNVVDPPLN